MKLDFRRLLYEKNVHCNGGTQIFTDLIEQTVFFILPFQFGTNFNLKEN